MLYYIIFGTGSHFKKFLTLQCSIYFSSKWHSHITEWAVGLHGLGLFANWTYFWTTTCFFFVRKSKNRPFFSTSKFHNWFYIQMPPATQHNCHIPLHLIWNKKSILSNNHDDHNMTLIINFLFYSILIYCEATSNKNIN